MWTEEAKKAYNSLKKELASDRVLVPYDPKLPLLLATDASPVGLGAVLSHIMPDGSERPISYASKALSETERRYPQIDREGMAVVWAAKRYFLYVYARKFTIFTDNRAISHSFAPNSNLPHFTLSRCANYAAYLSHFNYDIKFKTSAQNANADFLSRTMHLNSDREMQQNSVHERRNVSGDDFDEFMQNLHEMQNLHLMQISQTPLTARDIATETTKDAHMAEIFAALQMGTDLRAIGYKGTEAEYTANMGA